MDERVLRTAARYLGWKGGKPDIEMMELLSRAYDSMLAHIQPRFHIRCAPVSVGESGFRLDTLEPLPSRDLCCLFADSTEGLALIATLGAPLDTHIRRLMLTNPALGAAVGACAGAHIDEYIDAELERIKPSLLADGLTMSPRFSPGYGDVPLGFQRPFLQWLEAWRVGVTLTEGCLMLPEKSVSALIALRRKCHE